MKSERPRSKRVQWSIKSLAGYRLSAAALICLGLFLVSCSTVPITGREQLSLIPAGQLNSMGLDSYREFMAKHEVVRGTREADMVREVGGRIRAAVEGYLRDQGEVERIEGYDWEFSLIEEPSANAWAMPGGKVTVYTGILPVAGNEAGLATVMAHEIAHVIAGHGNERMSQALLTQLGGQALQVALAQQPALTQQLFMAAFGVGAQVGVLLPYSRLQESEADHLGLIFMALAGYDPRAAVEFWQRMTAAKEGPAPPQFLSTHPSGRERIARIRDLIPEALNYYTATARNP